MLDVEVADLTGSGVLDVIAVPATADTVEVFVGFGDESTRSYDPVFDEAGLGPRQAYGALAADFNRDSDPDLFLLRPETTEDGKEFLWANGAVDQQDPTEVGQFFTLELSVHDSLSTNPNTMATGAIVTSSVTRSDGAVINSSQLVDGGSGRGSQGAHRLIFGFGGAQSADVTVRWPHGAEQELTISASPEVGEDFVHRELIDTADPQTDGTSVSSSYTLDGNGGATHEYTWKTEHRCDSAQVLVKENRFSICNGAFGGAETLLLEPGSSDVTWNQEQDGDDWIQTLEWETTCAEDCSYKYNVRNMVGGSIHGWAEKTIFIGSCPIVVP